MLGGLGIYTGIAFILFPFGLGMLYKIIIRNRTFITSIVRMMIETFIIMIIMGLMIVVLSSFIFGVDNTIEIVENTWVPAFVLVPLSSSTLMYLTKLLIKRKTIALQQIENLEISLNTDRLTGLKNKYNFFKNLDEVLHIPPFMIIVCDIDGIEKVNVQNGLDSGNKIIKILSGVLNEYSDKCTVFKWDDFDFMIIMEIAEDMLDESKYYDYYRFVRKHFESRIMLDDITISFGKAVYSDDSQLLDIIKEAKDNLFTFKLIQKNSKNSQIINTFEKILDMKEIDSLEHSKNMSKVSHIFALHLGLQEDDLLYLEISARLHDIGKVEIDESILNKVTKLNEMEWKKVKMHPVLGKEILNNFVGLSKVSELVLTHHERWDGKGYPNQLKGKEIPYLSRVLSICDAYDVMIRGRVYRKPLTQKEAVDEILKNSGTQFDPELVTEFIRIKDQL
jgi:HD-GYP domain-containing protein (c-di-GMP phosphodiesterase class II)